MKIKILFILLITTHIFAQTDSNTTAKIQVELANPIMIETTKSAKAKFNNLKTQALQMGVQDIYLLGEIEYQRQGDYVVTNIVWQGLESAKDLSQSKFVSFQKTFKSQLSTNDDQILPPQEITVEVNKDILMEALNSLNKQNIIVPEEVKLDEKTIQELNKATTNSSGSNAANSTLPSVTPQAAVKDTSTSTKEVACAIRYSIDNLLAHEQKSIHVVDSSGNTQSVGACLDTGVTYKLSKVYGGLCQPLIGSDKVYQSYRIQGVVAGKDSIVRDCQVDLTNNTLDIKTTFDQCTYTHHLDLGLSYKATRKYYELAGKQIQISKCEAGTKPYQHKKSSCSYNLTIASGFAIPQVKTYLTQDDGSEFIVRNCTSESTSKLAITERACTADKRYHHDFTASTSYLNVTKWVTDPYSKIEVKVNDCAISATTYKHLLGSTGCTSIYEDHNFRMTQSYKSYIVDASQAPPQIFLTNTCANPAYIPYIKGATTILPGELFKQTEYTRPDKTKYPHTEVLTSKSFTKKSTFTVPDGISKIHIEAKGGIGTSCRANYGLLNTPVSTGDGPTITLTFPDNSVLIATGGGDRGVYLRSSPITCPTIIAPGTISKVVDVVAKDIIQIDFVTSETIFNNGSLVIKY